MARQSLEERTHTLGTMDWPFLRGSRISQAAERWENWTIWPQLATESTAVCVPNSTPVPNSHLSWGSAALPALELHENSPSLTLTPFSSKYLKGVPEFLR